MWSELIPFFGRRQQQQQQQIDLRKWQPALNVSLDRKVYRPGDSLIATIEIRNASNLEFPSETILVEDLVAQVKGGEKLDHQWLLVPPKSQTPHKQKRGERIFFESRGPLTCNYHLGVDSSKEYLIRTTLPKYLPPSYRGTSVRYFYYITVNVQWSFVSPEHGQIAVPLQKRIMFTVWNMPNHNGLTADDIQMKESYDLGGIVPVSLIETDMYWKDNDNFSEWSRTYGVLAAAEDDVSSQGSESLQHSPQRGGLESSFERLALPSPSPKRESLSRMGSKKSTSLTASSSDTCINKQQQGLRLQTQSSINRSSSENGTLWNGYIEDGYHSDQEEHHILSRSLGGYLRGKAYNIKIDDHVLAQVSPRNPDAVYYFGDTVAGVISFPNDGLRKCLEVAAVLEVREIVNPSFLHPSRKNSQVIAKVQAEYLEVVADVSQTKFIFSIPMDGPASFSTSHMTVQWVIRFEFMSTPATINWTKHDHPLQIKDRDRGEWVMPITVHAPLPRPHGKVRRERPVSSLREFWIQSPRASDWTSETPRETPRGSPVVGPSNGHL